jgi:hypothetical protein
MYFNFCYSGQKRQAYLTEINRLKNMSTVEATIDTSSSLDEISTADLTGLLIFSDLQLPIKESYLNRLKSGDGK